MLIALPAFKKVFVWWDITLVTKCVGAVVCIRLAYESVLALLR